VVGGLKYLLDTNIILELLLDQEQADKVARFLRQTTQRLYLSEFSLYSIGIILLRFKFYDAFASAISDLLTSGTVHLVRLKIEDMSRVADVARTFSLDFDDAYQYVAAEIYDLVLLSFDHDFDRTSRGRKTLEEVM
jgi:hypothetical protein